MKRLAGFVVLITTAIVVTVARSGHEFPIYPSYYPHEIQIETIAPEPAAALLREGKIQAYVGGEPRFAGAPPDSVRAVESLGSFVIIRVNPASLLAKDNASACAISRTILREIAAHHGNIVMHPYPITPFDGDYLFHVDLADAARTRLLGASANAPASVPRLKVHAAGGVVQSLVRPAWLTQRPEWDAAVEEVSAADLVAGAQTQINGWLGPPWLRTGWFHAALLLASSVDDPPMRERVQADLRRLQTRAYESAVERVNLERELVTTLATSCHAMVAGYTVKREYVSNEYSAGIENIGFDAVAGLASPIFIRTVKLKDFPWNGWLSLGVESPPAAAWNPIAGFTDGFGRLMWSTMGDPALIPAPNDAGWMLNRISDVQANPSR